MNYGTIKNLDVANGPGVRISLFVSGCRNHCDGCFQPETWPFDYGKEFTSETFQELMTLCCNPHVAGLSILGGDPFETENLDTVMAICYRFKLLFPKKNIWVWTGYLWEDIKDFYIMKYIDVLVDGPFVKDLKNLMLPYCGSENQRVIDVKKSLESDSVVFYK